MGDTGKAGAEAEQAIPLLRAIDDKWYMSILLTFLAGAKMQAGDMEAAIEATEEAIYNSLCMAETMTGYRNRTVNALPLEKVMALTR